ncbi:MAG: hypothetical protein JSV53_04310 [candidate division WOR-3 bacterium]|nr:MAG: hypothetical protein JSV53_04310 [candidate division WOR-3 bacterium]
MTDDTFGNLDAIIIDISCHPDTNFLPSMVFGSGSYNWRVQAVEGG